MSEPWTRHRQRTAPAEEHDEPDRGGAERGVDGDRAARATGRCASARGSGRPARTSGRRRRPRPARRAAPSTADRAARRAGSAPSPPSAGTAPTNAILRTQVQRAQRRSHLADHATARAPRPTTDISAPSATSGHQRVHARWSSPGTASRNAVTTASHIVAAEQRRRAPGTARNAAAPAMSRRTPKCAHAQQPTQTSATAVHSAARCARIEQAAHRRDFGDEPINQLVGVRRR